MRDQIVTQYTSFRQTPGVEARFIGVGLVGGYLCVQLEVDNLLERKILSFVGR